MQVVVFEDMQVEEFQPLVQLKPIYALYTGFRSLRDKLEHALRGRATLTYHMRRYLAPCYQEQHPELMINRIEDADILLVNGRLLGDEAVAQMIVDEACDVGTAFIQNNTLLFARVDRHELLGESGLLPEVIHTNRLIEQLRIEEVSGFRVLEHLWDIIAFHTDELLRDAETLELGRIEGEVHHTAVLVNRSNIYVGAGAVVRAGAVLDADDGFIAVGGGAIVEPNAVLMQNVFLGAWARAKIGAKLYSNVSIGMASKVGGEVEDSLLEPFVNKQHDGFLGHSYLSSWCNLGAGTNTSDLKNNYSEVQLHRNGEFVPTGLQFLGLLMGDHSKCSINSMFNTGTVVGVGANIFGGGFPPKEVPSFAWGGNQGFERYDIEKAVETARKVMARRKVTMSASYETMFRYVAGLT